MTTEHDFLHAIGLFFHGRFETKDGKYVSCADVLANKEAEDAIEFALRFTHKLLKHEPSHPMLDAAIKSYNQSGQFALQSHFTAMIEQAVKEIEND